LQKLGAGRGAVVGLCAHRNADLLVGILGILKTGAAYLPIDPEQPRSRRAHVLDDSKVELLAASRGFETLFPSARIATIGSAGANSGPVSPGSRDPSDLAYVIYTSGSTGRPKGVAVSHANVMNFFAGMDLRVPRNGASRLLAISNVAFDISVLELCWTLARGMTVVLQDDSADRHPSFSLFYFASEASGSDSYDLLLEGAKFADQTGF